MEFTIQQSDLAYALTTALASVPSKSTLAILSAVLLEAEKDELRITGTDLDVTLRNLGVRTVVATGMSVNVGILGMVMGAVDLGYEAVVVTDAVAGIPAAYAQAVVDNTLAALATRVTSDEIVAVWAP